MAEGKDTPEEKELIRQALLGGPEGKLAFVALAKKKEGPLRGILTPILRKPEDVEEVFWYALQKAWAAFATPNPPLDFHKFLVTTALNRARNYTRSLAWKRERARGRQEKEDKKERRRLEEKGQEAPEGVDVLHLTPEEAVARVEEISLVRDAIEETFKDRPIVQKVLELKYGLDLDRLDIAAILGLKNEQEVKNILQDAKRKLLPVLRAKLGIDTASAPGLLTLVKEATKEED